MHICTFIFFLKTQTNRNKVKISHIPTTYPFLLLLLLLNLRDWKARIFPTILDLKSLLNYYNYTTNCPQVQENYLIGKGKTCTKYFSKYLLKMWNIAVITWNLTMILTEIEFVEKKKYPEFKEAEWVKFCHVIFCYFFPLWFVGMFFNNFKVCQHPFQCSTMTWHNWYYIFSVKLKSLKK